MKPAALYLALGVGALLATLGISYDVAIATIAGSALCMVALFESYVA